MPSITIIDWATSPQGDPDSTIERRIIGDHAELRRFLCETDADLTDEICESNAIIVWHNMPLTAKGIARLKNCRAIIRNGVGFDSVDIAAARERGIAVCNVPDYGTEEVADHAIALAMALCRQLFPLDAEAKRLGWLIQVEQRLRRLRELTFGIVGLGRIGTATALRVKLGAIAEKLDDEGFPTHYGEDEQGGPIPLPDRVGMLLTLTDRLEAEALAWRADAGKAEAEIFTAHKELADLGSPRFAGGQLLTVAHRIRALPGLLRPE
jgi:hypothetical protein